MLFEALNTGWLISPSTKLYEVVYLITHILHRRTLRHREVKTPVEDNTIGGRAGIGTSSLTP